MKIYVNQSSSIISPISFCLYQMNGQFEFRAVLLKIQDFLSQSDRSRFNFLLGEDVPRNLRDDPSLCGALRVLESLLDRAIINDQDCTYLIKAFKQIQCHDAAKRLQGLFICFYFEYESCSRRINLCLLAYQETQGQNKGLGLSLPTILLNDNEEDKICSAGMYQEEVVPLFEIGSLIHV
jgi:hypothetical protein